MDQYGEMEEGALDADDIEGTLDEAGERMQQLIRNTQYSIRSGSSSQFYGSDPDSLDPDSLDPVPGRAKIDLDKI
jgi:hypothetical protein